ncbi:MAG TPA: YciI family protein [Pseudomonadales bacterium]
MRYLLLIWENEALSAARSDQENEAVMAEYIALTRDMRERGVFRAGDPLLPSETATTVRVRKGETLTTDGPFAETREQLGGYYIVECETLEEACGWAARIPTARDGAIEVRPILEIDG